MVDQAYRIFEIREHAMPLPARISLGWLSAPARLTTLGLVMLVFAAVPAQDTGNSSAPPVSSEGLQQTRTTTPSLYLSRIKTRVPLNSFVEIFPVEGPDTLTIAQTSSAPFSGYFLTIDRLYKIAPKTWVRFSIINDLEVDQTFLLESRHWDFVTLYVPNFQQQFDLRITGRTIPLIEWDVKRSFQGRMLQRFTIRRGESATLYVELLNRHQAPDAIELAVLNSDFFEQWDRDNRLWQGLFAGILLMLVAVVMVIAFRDKSMSALWLSLYVLAAMLLWSSVYGYAYEIWWPESPQWNNFSQPFFFALMTLGLTRHLDLYHQSYLPSNIMRRVLPLLMLLGLLPAAMAWIYNTELGTWAILLPIALLLIISAIIISGISAYRGDKPARATLAGHLLLFAFGALFVFDAFRNDALERWGKEILQTGLLLQIFSLAIGLVWRQRNIRTATWYGLASDEHRRAHNAIQQARTLLERDRLKDRFLANTSHELRTPLNGIVGIAESLRDGSSGSLPPYVIDNLDLIVNSGRRLGNLVNDILDFSQLQKGILKLQRISIDLHSQVENVLKLSQPLISGKNLSLETQIPPDLPPIDADEDRLQQILHNLVFNAIKFTDQGRIVVGAAVKDEKFIEIFVSDSGVGIAPENLERIFLPFTQEQSGDNREHDGAGLGLNIVRQLVELHGGGISVESQPGQGSTFRILLPLSNQHPRKVNRQPGISRVRSDHATFRQQPDRAPHAQNGRFRILVVDDEPVNRQVLENHLAFDNYEITQAFDGEEALRKIGNDNPFDLILLDIMMPRMSGFVVSQKIREQFLPNELPIIMLTAKNQVSDLIEGLSSGANDYLTKPFSRNELLARVRTHLNLKQINGAYARFIPREFLRTLGRQSIMDVQLGDQVQGEMTVLFSDIRSFTSLSESMSPKENFDFLNEYLNYVTPSIRNNHGFIDKYIGDAIMAIFPRSADDALQAAITALRELRRYNQLRADRHQPLIEIAVGLHTGSLMLGTIGDSERMDGTVISDAVNLASRLEGLTKKYGAAIIISEQTRQGLTNADQFGIRPLGAVQVKGKSESVQIFEVYDGLAPETIECRVKSAQYYQVGMAHYYQRNFAEAVMAFKKVLDIDPDDRTARLYLSNSAEFVVKGVPENWQGVEEMQSK